jgi:cytochrome oxidase Cu insertion factor (SCO1/SenC/PrrC family)
VDGEHFSLAAERGKAVVLFFMTTDCPDCVAETHALGQLARLDKTGKLSILMVAMTPQSDTAEAIRAYRTRNQGPDRYWMVDQGGAITQAYGITALTSTVLIDHTGHIAAHYTATSLDLATLQTVVRPLL